MPAQMVVFVGLRTEVPPLTVDPINNLGFVVASAADGSDGKEAWWGVYDLHDGKLIGRERARHLPPFEGGAGFAEGNAEVYTPPNEWLIDPVRQRIFVPQADDSNLVPICTEWDGEQGFPQHFDANEFDPTGELPEVNPVPVLSNRSRPVVLRKISYSVNPGRSGVTIDQDPVFVPCNDSFLKFNVFAPAYHRDSGRFYFTGNYKADAGAVRLVADALAGTQQNEGDHLLVRQVSLVSAPDGTEELRLDWEVDLQTAGCGRREHQFVARAGNLVLAYCYDLRVGTSQATGGQGYVVAMRLDENDQPVVRGGEPITDPVSGAIVNAVVRRTPALSGRVFPVADPATGTLLLATSDDRNGDAGWVFDPVQERFVGVVTGGFRDPPPGNAAVGFDAERGRLYLLTVGGVLVVPVRTRPLSPGEQTDVLANPERVSDFVANPFKDDMAVVPISAAPSVGKLFVPMRRPGRCPGSSEPCLHYAVLRDEIPNPPAPPTVDPDRLTAQVDEVDGLTTVNASGGAVGSGAHVVVTGGIPKIVSQASPTCHSPGGSIVGQEQLVLERQIFGGACAPEQLVTSGHREWLFAPASLTLGTAQGVSADASGFSVAPNDFATDNDIRRASDCHETTVRSLGTAVERFFTEQGGGDQGDEGDEGGEGDAPGRSPVCEAVQDAFTAQTGDDLGQGTRGGTSEEPGEGFPVRHAHCDDFGAGATTEEQPTESDDDPRGLTFASNVMCDLARVAGEASAASRAFSIAPPGTPGLTVARTAAQATSAKTGEGQVTTVTATAEGVVVGPLQIGKVYTQAVTKARGHTGRASTNLTRLWCGVAIAGVAVEHCIDPTTDENQAAIDDLNQGLQRLRITVPRANGEDANGEATPGGYQAVVTKDSEVRAADSAVNDDDSHTVPGLQATFYNDGAEGRSRVVVQLAGVHAESRYGIVQIPQFTSPGFTLPTSLSAPAYSDGGFVPPRPGRLVGAAGYDEFLVEHPVLTARDESTEVLMDQVRRAPFGALRNFLNWLVNHPREAALLFVMWALLSFPVYLIVRRRSFEFVAAMEASFP